MASKVQICNRALVRLGAKRITSLTDDTPEAILCNTLFNDVADEVMSEGPWSTTITRATLAKTTNTPVYGFSNEFQLPVLPLALRVLEINELQTTTGGTFTNTTIDYSIEQDKLLTDLDAVSIRYIGRITDTEKYGVYLTTAIIFRMGAEMSFSLAGAETHYERLWAQYEEAKDKGIAIDNTQGAQQVLTTSELLIVR